jgi:hypothetical protein
MVIGIKKDILRLQVPMDDLLLMHILKYRNYLCSIELSQLIGKFFYH